MYNGCIEGRAKDGATGPSKELSSALAFFRQKEGEAACAICGLGGKRTRPRNH